LSFERAVNDLWHKKGQPLAIAWIFSGLWLLLIGSTAFLWNLGTTGLIDETEPLFAEAARQMTVTGDWITPYFNGETRFDKPALIYWLMAIAYKIVGVNSLGARLPSALSVFALTGLIFYTLNFYGGSPQDRRRHYWLCAGLGSAFFALNPEIVIWSRIGASDALLTACIGGALLSFFQGYAQPEKPAIQTRWYLAFYVLVALAVLTKGPVGLVLPVLIIGAFLLYLGNFRAVWREMRPLWGSLLVVAIALPWYVLVTMRNGWSFINSFLGYHNIERFTSVVNHHSAPWYFYFLVVLVGFCPWSIYLPVAIARLKFWQRSHWSSVARSHQLGLFALFWFAGVFGFFTIAVTKLPSYMLPLMPAAAILVAMMWSEQVTLGKKKNSFLVGSGWFNVLFLSILAVALAYSPRFIGFDPAMVNPRQLIEQSGLPIIGCIVWAITALAIAVLLWQKQWLGIPAANLVGFFAFLLFVLMPAGLLIDQARQLPLRQLSAIVTRFEQPGESLVMMGFKKPTVVFYTQRRVKYIMFPRDVRYGIKSVGDAPSVLILAQPSKIDLLGLAAGQYQELGRAGTYELIRVERRLLS